MNNSTGRLQRLPIEFWMPQNRSLYDKSFYVNIWETDVKEGTRPTEIEKYKDAVDCVHRIRELNSEKEQFAFASGPVECYGGQHSVFAFTGVKEGIKFLNKETKAFKLIRQAYNCLFNFADNIQKVGRPKTEIVCPKKNTDIIDKSDPTRIIIAVKYHENDEHPWSFRCRKWHIAKEFVCVHTRRRDETKKHYRNVQVIECKLMKESEIKTLAKSIGYSDISEVYCDNAIETDEAWELWREPEEYQENMEELQAMMEAFAPVCDYIPQAPDTPYDGENFDVCEDEDELPE